MDTNDSCKVNLTIQSTNNGDYVPLVGSRIVIGRGEEADLKLDDDGLSRKHAAINRKDNVVWVTDEGSTNGTFVNNQPVPPDGLLLSDNDLIAIGNHTTIRVTITKPLQPAAGPQMQTSPPPAKGGNRTPLYSALAMGSILLVLGCLLGYRVLGARTNRDSDELPARPVTIAESKPSQTSEPTPAKNAEADKPILQPESAAVASTLPIASAKKLYLDMSPEERSDFVNRQAERVALMMGNRPYVFTDDVVVIIKRYVDSYALRSRSNSTKLWAEGLPTLYGRASRYAPLIIRSFNARKVPPVVGLYIAMIETEYHTDLRSPVGALGMFQFMPATASQFGVKPEDRTNVELMAPAAAAYINQRIAEFGNDPMSVALGIAGYNRSPDSVRRDLHDVLNQEGANRERSFWTLVANSDKLDRPFQDENVKYVPKFFAAAIVGENPEYFGLNLRPLSNYVEDNLHP